MGAIAEALLAYAQPLIDQSDGTEEGLNRALQLGQICYNLALAPVDERERLIAGMQQDLGLNDAEFDEFRRGLIDPMLRRHAEMFPGLREFGFAGAATSPAIPQVHARKVSPGEKYPGTERYAPCPCGSGEKYKFCCGSKRR